jgi:hypothetical protein
MCINNYLVIFYFIEESSLSEERQSDLAKKISVRNYQIFKSKRLSTYHDRRNYIHSGIPKYMQSTTFSRQMI